MKIMLTGDVMLGRGIDQALPKPCTPELYEGFVSSAVTYIDLAERKYGAIARPVTFDYVWGDALKVLASASPDVRIINLETAMTRRGKPEPKGIHYRTAPEHVRCLTAAGIDCCVLANNHVLDWGEEGLRDTLKALDEAGIARAGAGRNADEATTPAILPLGDGKRLLVYGVGHVSAGVPSQWAARADRAGVALLPDFTETSVRAIARRIGVDRRPGDLVVLSVHWGPNWGYDIGTERELAHHLIDTGGVDLLHGHSSHHPKGIERYRNKLILYGCGDLLNDYEGIGGHEEFRSDLVLIFLPELDAEGTCTGLELLPFQIARFRLNTASMTDAKWLAHTLAKRSPAGLRVDLSQMPYNALTVTFAS